MHFGPPPAGPEFDTLPSADACAAGRQQLGGRRAHHVRIGSININDAKLACSQSLRKSGFAAANFEFIGDPTKTCIALASSLPPSMSN